MGCSASGRRDFPGCVLAGPKSTGNAWRYTLPWIKAASRRCDQFSEDIEPSPKAGNLGRRLLAARIRARNRNFHDSVSKLPRADRQIEQQFVSSKDTPERRNAWVQQISG